VDVLPPRIVGVTPAVARHTVPAAGRPALPRSTTVAIRPSSRPVRAVLACPGASACPSRRLPTPSAITGAAGLPAPSLRGGRSFSRGGLGASMLAAGPIGAVGAPPSLGLRRAARIPRSECCVDWRKWPILD
jgi:hypothetical protein